MTKLSSYLVCMKNNRGLLLAFLLPFLIVGGLTVWHWYDYSYDDIQRGRRLGEPLFQPGDEKSAFETALLMGIIGATGAGVSSVIAYASFHALSRKALEPFSPNNVNPSL